MGVTELCSHNRAHIEVHGTCPVSPYNSGYMLIKNHGLLNHTQYVHKYSSLKVLLLEERIPVHAAPDTACSAVHGVTPQESCRLYALPHRLLCVLIQSVQLRSPVI